MPHRFDEAVAGRLNTILADRNLPRRQDRYRYLRRRILNRFHSDMGMSAATIHNIMVARTPLTLERAIVIAIALNMPVGHLLADPRHRNGPSIKRDHVPEIRYDTNGMVLQQCRLHTAEYEHLDIIDIQRRIRANLRRLLSDRHELWDGTGDDEATRLPPAGAEGTRTDPRTHAPGHGDAGSRLALTSRRFLTHITTSYYHDSLGFRPYTLRDVAEGRRSLLLRETLVIMHVFDCDLDFGHGEPYAPAPATPSETRDVLRGIEMACDQITAINQMITEARSVNDLADMDFTYVDTIHDAAFLRRLKLSDDADARLRQREQLNRLRSFSSDTAIGKVFMWMDRLLDTSRDPNALRNQMNELLGSQNDPANDHPYLSPTVWPDGGHYPECMNYYGDGKDGGSHRMRCPLCTLANGSVEEIRKLTTQDRQAITKMLRGQFQRIYTSLFWDDTPDYLTATDRMNLNATRQALRRNRELTTKLKACHTQAKQIYGTAIATEFPQLERLLDTVPTPTPHGRTTTNR